VKRVGRGPWPGRVGTFSPAWPPPGSRSGRFQLKDATVIGFPDPRFHCEKGAGFLRQTVVIGFAGAVV